MLDSEYRQRAVVAIFFYGFSGFCVGTFGAFNAPFSAVEPFDVVEINGKMNFVISEDAACLQNDEHFITTLWVWEADADDDYNDDCPDCLAVAY